MISRFKSIFKFEQPTFRWGDLLLVTLLVCAAYTFMEWLFIVTKPSFLNEASFSAKFLVLAESFLIFFTICVAPLLVFFLLGKITGRMNTLATKIGLLVPAFVMASLMMLLIDNFTYTVFKFGVSSTSGVTRGIYGLLFLALLFFSYRYLYQHLPFKVYHPRLNMVIFGFVILGTLVILLNLNRNRTAYASEVDRTDKRPNILLIGSDGVNANNMSVYGYERDTTPNIKKFAEGALVVQNNFANSSNTSGSLTSILTSKYPTETRVLYPPDILKGVDAYQHLPGILKQLGYYSVELGAPHFADAYTLGMLNGFDEVNNRFAANNIYFELVDVGFTNDVAYFLSTIYERIVSRVLHIFYIAEMRNPYDLVTRSSNLISDQEKITTITNLFGEHKDQPLFVHVHLMGTHGPTFDPSVKKFSEGTIQDGAWNTDYYDDSIYNFDILFGKLIDRLRKKNLLDNTVIILYSDHGMGFNANKRVPLIFKFPGVDFGGEEVKIGQNLDIAPTLLDYMGVTKPDWMTGNSLWKNHNELAPIISTGASNTVNVDGEGWVQNELYNQPPFYQFDYINLIYCQRWYRLNLESYEWSSGEIENYQAPCPESKLLTAKQIYTILVDRLREDGFEIPEGIQESKQFDAEANKPASTDPTPTPAITPSPTPEITPTPIPEDENSNLVEWDYPETGWNPLIAHGFGEWENILSPNNYEAFVESYAEGYRTFEVDIEMSSDGIPLAAHDRQEENYYGLTGKFSDHTAEEFLQAKLVNKGKTLAGQQILDLLKEYPDIRIVLDLKVEDQTKALGWFLGRLPKSQWPRVLSNIRNEKNIEKLTVGFPDYRGAFLQVGPWKDDLVYSDEDIKRMVTQYNLAGVFTWVDELDPNLGYIENNVAHKRWTQTLENFMVEANKAMIWHTSDDPVLNDQRRSAGGAIITNTARPKQSPDRVVLISIDGLRPEAIEPQYMPNLVSLMENGAFSLKAKTILPSLTLPGHASMLTGLCPSQHGITWNEYMPERGYAKGVDLFEIADGAGLRTAMVVGKLKLRQTTEPENTDYFETITTGDGSIASKVSLIIESGFDLLFVHFPDNDIYGHEYGWLSEEQLSHLKETDQALEEILNELRNTSRGDDTLIVVTADHGGLNTGHGSDQPEVVTIPWIVSGFGVGHKQLSTPINITDTPPTIAYALDLPIPAEWVGHPILEAFGVSSDTVPETICP